MASFILSAPAVSDLREITPTSPPTIQRRPAKYLVIHRSETRPPQIGRCVLSGYRDIATLFE